ncbi:MAG: hypothetical protein M0P13_06995, partial [Fibrobacteraceae bacterium]|nr:hypothetical protein [Fibrobacteraceae bacterium]
FQEADRKAHSLIRWYFKNKMDVILLDVTLNYRQVLPFAKTPDHVADIKADLYVHHTESIFWAPDDVILAFVDGMNLPVQGIYALVTISGLLYSEHSYRIRKPRAQHGGFF